MVSIWNHLPIIFLNCPRYAVPRNQQINDTGNIIDDEININILFFGKKEYTLEQNKGILNCDFEFIKNSKCFERQRDIF